METDPLIARPSPTAGDGDQDTPRRARCQLARCGLALGLWALYLLLLGSCLTRAYELSDLENLESDYYSYVLDVNFALLSAMSATGLAMGAVSGSLGSAPVLAQWPAAIWAVRFLRAAGYVAIVLILPFLSVVAFLQPLCERALALFPFVRAWGMDGVFNFLLLSAVLWTVFLAVRLLRAVYRLLRWLVGLLVRLARLLLRGARRTPAAAPEEPV